MAPKTEAVVSKEPPPTIYLRDEQIKKFAGDTFDNLKVGDTMEVTFKVKVVGQNERTETEYDDKGEQKGTKTHKSIDLELIEKETKQESGVEKAVKELGRRAKY